MVEQTNSRNFQILFVLKFSLKANTVALPAAILKDE